ncbi:alpha/beta hydrolase [Pyxidicoccus fallax]|uniref:Alpha/beta hydrolase n=1 Tax=Pyxidicoccus fallax TaxID=394095 RepID=A0A848LV92_9BACT|nr:alpha/beta hydrolase [Pyxidicoccus fallax]NMO21551.1 alpha/beta hydrolase [Pyxidicoccus fallax]NPC84845.1 alpha/beta hydrolase [Pyxidicoccus fallax]
MTHSSDVSRRLFLQAGAALPLAACATPSASHTTAAAPLSSPSGFEQHRFTSADGTSLSCFRKGTGPALVWVHGALSLWSDWRDVAERLSPHFTNYVLERRGRGQSGDSPRHALEREVEDVLALMELAGPGASLFGHSYGGVLALEVARRTPPAKLLVYEPPLPVTQPVSGPFLDDFRRTLGREGPDAALVLFNQRLLHTPPAELEAFRQTPVWARQVEMTPVFTRELEALETLPVGLGRYREVRVPTLVILGDQSTEVLLARPARALAEALPQARLKVLAGQGHVAHVTAPDLLAREVHAFLRGS